jgi:hypothetical protein
MAGEPPPITPEFNAAPEPPAVAESFDAASMSNDQAASLESQRQNLESMRAVPEVQGMDYTPGGVVEQSVHQSTNERMAPEREREIQELTARLDRRQVVEEKPAANLSPREAEIQRLAAQFKNNNRRKM